MIEALLNDFRPVSLEEMGKVRLMNRVDTKYVTDIETVKTLLRQAAPYYLVQEIDSRRNMPYRTLYFDTADTRMYYDHQRGKKSRRKIRLRTYENPEDGNGGLTFLEIKDKNNKGRTRKKRVAFEAGADLCFYEDFIAAHSEFHCDALYQQIENHFSRITLANPEWTERITIDTMMNFNSFRTMQSLSLPKVSVIEWKRDMLAGRSQMARLLHSLHIRPAGFSKYVVGMALTDPQLPHNRIKQRLRFINALENGDPDFLNALLNPYQPIYAN